VLTGLRILAALAILFFLVSTTVRQWSEVRATFGVLSWQAIVLALLAALAGIGANMMGWRAAVAGVDRRLPVRTAAPIALVGQLGKYLPGSLWAYLVQMELARRAGVSRTNALLGALAATGLGVTVGLVLGTIGLPTAFEAARDSEHGAVGRLAFIVALVLLPIALVCAHPAVLTRLLRLLLRVLRRPPMPTALSWRGVLEPMGWALVAYTAFGTHLWLLAESQAAPGIGGWARCVGTIALAMGVSVFVIVAPSGIGVREFLIAVALGGFGVSFSTAFAIALASRLIFTMADIVAAGVAGAVGTRRLRDQVQDHSASVPLNAD
jgi:glycosyltransferase 2 family protein